MSCADTSEDRRRPVCINVECGAHATHVVFWPRRPALATCATCALRAVNVGRSLRVDVEVSELSEPTLIVPFGDDRALEN